MSAAMAGNDEAKQNSENYFRAYGCERDPFSDRGISGLFFDGGERKKVVDELLHFARYTRSPLLLQGGPGTGKTTLLRELQAQAEQDMDVGFVQVEILQGERQLLEAIHSAFRQPPGDSEQLFEQFCRWVLEQSQRQRYVVLCLDDAHNLSTDFLRAFFELINLPGSQFKLVLAGEQDLASVLDSLASHYELTLNTLELVPFNEQAVREYALYRLRAAGYGGELPFTDIQIKAAQRRSNGNIEQLNSLLRDMLIAGGDYRRPIKFGYPLINLALALVISGLLLLFALQDSENQQSVETEEFGPLALERPRPPEISPTAPNSAVQQLNEKDRVVATRSDQGLAGEPATLTENVKPQDSAGKSVAEARPANIVMAESATEPAHTASAVDAHNDSEHTQTTSRSEAEGGDGSESLARVEPEADKFAEPSPELAPIPAASRASTAQQRASEQAAVRDRLQNWPETGYALQVFGTHNAQRARKLVEQYFGEADLLFYETRHNGKPWFVVINGPFSGRQSAQQSIALLPENLQRLRPWPRNIASIKSDIERYQAILGRPSR